MRVEKRDESAESRSAPPTEAAADAGIVEESAVVETAPEPQAAEVGTTPTQARGPAGGPLSAMMALPEPQRTEQMERAVQSGQAFFIRSKTGGAVRVSYGEHVLEVTPEGRQFMAPHAIHLLWTAPDKVEETSG
jgi:hypothetical protein